MAVRLSLGAPPALASASMLSVGDAGAATKVETTARFDGALVLAGKAFPDNSVILGSPAKAARESGPSAAKAPVQAKAPAAEQEWTGATKTGRR